MKRFFVLLLPFILVGCSVSGTKTIEPKIIAHLENGDIELVISRKGTPNIILISGYGSGIDEAWGGIFPSIKDITTVVAYNRFNYGNSSSTETPQTAILVTKTLREILINQNINPPYIFVAHSIGGLYANLYARKHPEDVAGIVLIDSSHPEQQKNLGPKIGLFSKSIMWLDSVFNSNRHTEVSTFNKTAEQISQAAAFPDIPLIILTAGKTASKEIMEVHHQNQKDLVSMSPQGKQLIIEGSGHFIQNEFPSIVIEEIRKMVTKIKNKMNNKSKDG